MDIIELLERGRRFVRVISLEHITLAVVVVSTAIFGYFYGRLIVEERHARQEQNKVRQEVLYEEKRHRDLKSLFVQGNEDWVLIQEAARIFGVAVPGTVVFQTTGEEILGNTTAGNNPTGENETRSVPVWQLWQKTFRLSH